MVTATPTQRSGTRKTAHTIVLDAGPIIANDPPISTLLQACESVVVTPSVLAEIKDSRTRDRITTTLLPFVIQRNPRSTSVDFVSKFAAQTGDAAVLSRVDLLVAALAYEIECERNRGDWRLRKTPGQKSINGKPPPDLAREHTPQIQEQISTEPTPVIKPLKPTTERTDPSDDRGLLESDASHASPLAVEQSSLISEDEALAKEVEDLELVEAQPGSEVDEKLGDAPSEDSSDDESDWITPSNLKKKQDRRTDPSSSSADDPFSMQVTTITGDYALQNVLLQINLNLMSSNLNRIKQIRTWILRCHACFKVTKDMTKQFCPSCGGATLTRVSCSTSQNGEFKLHMKKGWQYNSRGDKFSIPKPISGSSSGRRLEGGGKNHWGTNLMLREDQKEYVQARQDSDREHRKMARDMFDQDYLPDILTGRRQGGRDSGLKVGAGKNVNARKRR